MTLYAPSTLRQAMPERNTEIPRTQIVMLRVSPMERATLAAAATAKGLPLSTYARVMALAAAKRVKVAA